MFDLEDVAIILEYLEQFALDCEFDYKKSLYLLEMLRVAAPDVDHSDDELEAEYCRKYYEEVRTVVTMVRNRYESWKRFLAQDPIEVEQPPF